MRGLEALAVMPTAGACPSGRGRPGGFDEVSLHTATNLRDRSEGQPKPAPTSPRSRLRARGRCRSDRICLCTGLLLGGARTGGLQEVLARVRQLGAPSTGWCSSLCGRGPRAGVGRRRSSGGPGLDRLSGGGRRRAARPGRLQTCTKLDEDRAAGCAVFGLFMTGPGDGGRCWARWCRGRWCRGGPGAGCSKRCGRR